MTNLKEPSVGIIVLNWNQKIATVNCLSWLLKINYSNFKIFAVDNGSQDNSCQYFKKRFGSKITLICHKKNLGYAQGNNLAIKEVLSKDFDFILLINNDVEVNKDFLKEMIGVALKYPKFGMLVPKVYYSQKRSILQSAGGKMVWQYGEARLRGNLEKNTKRFNQIEEVDYAPGICVLVKAKTIKKIGYLPKEYFMYQEDVDWSFRAKKAGYQIIFVPKARVYHFDSLSAQSESSTKTYYYIRNILIFMKKWASGYVWIYFVPFFSLKILKMIIKYLLQGKIDNIKAIIKAYLNFLRGEKGESKAYTFDYRS